MKTKELIKELRKNIKCTNCNKLLFKGKFWGNYSIEFKCPRCKSMTEITSKLPILEKK